MLLLMLLYFVMMQCSSILGHLELTWSQIDATAAAAAAVVEPFRALRAL